MVELRGSPEEVRVYPTLSIPEMRVKYGLKRRTAPHGYTFNVPVGHISSSAGTSCLMSVPTLNRSASTMETSLRQTKYGFAPFTNSLQITL